VRPALAGVVLPMFSLEETLTWTADDVFVRIRLVLPPGWKLEYALEEGWHYLKVLDAEGVQQWAGEHVDPKLAGLDALGWLKLRDYQVKNPAWQPREHEVPHYRPSGVVVSSQPDPADLDPKEIDAVYRTSR